MMVFIRMIMALGLLAPFVFSAVGNEDPIDVWKRLPEAKKKELIDRYRYFKSLPEEEKGNLKERHRKLKVIRDSLDAGEDTPGQEQNRRVKKMFREREDSLRKLMKIPPGEPLDKQMGGLKKRLERMNHEQFDKFLDKLVKEELLKERDAKRIRSLPEKERKKKAFELGKKRFLKEMKGLIPEHEEESLQEMEPWKFHRMMRGQRERMGMAGPAGRLSVLTPEQKKTLETVPEGPERRRMSERFFDENLRNRLEKMGVDRETTDSVLAMSQPERRRWIMEKLKSFKDHPEQISPEIEELLDSPSHERQRDGDRRRRHRQPQR